MLKNDNNNNNNINNYNYNNDDKISYTLSPLEDTNFFVRLIKVRLFTYEVTFLIYNIAFSSRLVRLHNVGLRKGKNSKVTNLPPFGKSLHVCVLLSALLLLYKKDLS